MAKFAFLVSVAFLAVFPLASNANTSSSTAIVADLGEADVTAREHSHQNGRGNPRTPVIRKEYGMIFLLGAILSGVLGIIGASRRSAALQYVPSGPLLTYYWDLRLRTDSNRLTKVDLGLTQVESIATRSRTSRPEIVNILPFAHLGNRHVGSFTCNRFDIRVLLTTAFHPHLQWP
ncbi:hypothetical protein EMWEY_00060510 [Eimeria maxima]|uniref:Uncharacterized protein n=1 Tax=Eimeria maxima TaxID=5804 RepID=U6M805_EIMMA|nr:hypothetical protein EMWEY_00060510 [Eimeria maxima]CDJ60352.1 hypothetical protein EMWEY_00060510 [Eimeria maxima]